MMIDSKIKQETHILILIVLYKCPLLESVTFNSIIAQEEHLGSYKLIVWDNSPNEIEEQNLINIKYRVDFDYISRPENVSLSKVYNTILDNYNFDYLLLLDQDTGIPTNYFDKIKEYLLKHRSIDLFLPIVKNGDLIVSPGNFHYFKGKHWKKARTGMLKAKNVIAVTSGMLISNKYLKGNHYRFDERLNLYGIDTKFMIDYFKSNAELVVLPIEFKHNSALWSKSTGSAMLPRFLNSRKAWKIILSDTPAAQALTMVHGLYLAVKLSFKYRNYSFLSDYLKKVVF